MLRLAGKFAAWALLVGSFQIALGNLTRDRDINPLQIQADRALEPGLDVLFLGDSVFSQTAAQDSDRRPLATMLKDELVPSRVQVVHSVAFCAEPYRAILEYALSRGARPKRVVVTLNLRSFGPLWDTAPGLRYSMEEARLRWGDTLVYGFDRPLRSYQIYARLEGYARSETDRLRTPVFREGKTLGTLEQVLEGLGPCQRMPWKERVFSLLYMYSLEGGHRKLNVLLELASACKAAGVPLLAYVTPVDMESGDAAVGPAFGHQVRRNVEVLRKALVSRGARFADLGSLLESVCFDYGRFPNEHLNDRGRIRLARTLKSLAQEVDPGIREGPRR